MLEGRIRTSPIAKERSQLINFLDFIKHSEHMSTRLATERNQEESHIQQLPLRNRKFIRGWKGISADCRHRGLEAVEAKEVAMAPQVKEPLPESNHRRYKIYQEGVKLRYLRRIERAEKLHKREVFLPQVQPPTGRYSQIRSVELSESLQQHMPILHLEKKLTGKQPSRAASKTEVSVKEENGLIGVHKQINTRRREDPRHEHPKERYSMVDIFERKQQHRRRDLKCIVYDIQPWQINDQDPDLD